MFRLAPFQCWETMTLQLLPQFQRQIRKEGKKKTKKKQFSLIMHKQYGVLCHEFTHTFALECGADEFYLGAGICSET